MRRRRPFTLLELIIAVSVFTMVSLALYAYSSGVTDSWGRLSTERNRFNEVMELDRAVNSIFPYAVPFLWRDPDSETSQELPFILATDSMLRLAYFHKLNDADEGAIRFVQLELRDGDLLATYTDRPFITWETAPQDRLQTSILASGVSELHFRYADHINDPAEDWNTRLFWREDWDDPDDDTDDREDIPLAIQMTVTWEDGRVETWLRRTMGVSYRERYGTWTLPQDNGL